MTVSFLTYDGGLFVEITTQHLYMRSTQPSDVSHYTHLYGDPDVMAMLCGGETRTPEVVAKRVQIAVDRWKNQNPYNVFSVFKKDDRTFLGVSVLTAAEKPGIAELSGIGHKGFWKQGYGTEVAEALVGPYAAKLKEKQYLVNGAPLCQIEATARVDHSSSNKILEKIGMQYDKTVKKYGSQRNYYLMNV